MAESTWEEILAGTVKGLARERWFMSRLPAPPRCKFCLAPFRGPFAPILRVLGYGRWELSSQLCRRCIASLGDKPGGAEVEVSLLFADVRDSTTLAENLPPAEFGKMLGHFYDRAGKIIDRHHGIVDKVVGDEVVAMFLPGFGATEHARMAIESAHEIVNDPQALPLGAGVHTGVAYVGALGPTEGIRDFTAVGDTVNVAARLASMALTGEVLVSDEAVGSSLFATGGGVHRRLAVKGRQEEVGVWVFGGQH